MASFQGICRFIPSFPAEHQQVNRNVDLTLLNSRRLCGDALKVADWPAKVADCPNVATEAPKTPEAPDRRRMCVCVCLVACGCVCAGNKTTSVQPSAQISRIQYICKQCIPRQQVRNCNHGVSTSFCADAFVQNSRVPGLVFDYCNNLSLLFVNGGNNICNKL